MFKFIEQVRASKQWNKVVRLTAIITVIAIINTGCSSLQDNQQSAITTASSSSDVSHVITIVPQANDTPESLLATYGGKILAFESGEIALIGLDVTEAASYSANGLSVQSLSTNDSSIEENNNSFVAGGVGIDSKSSSVWSGGSSSVWSGGSSSVWSGGSSSVWSGGSSSVWSGGEYNWMPENTGLWQQIGLEKGHAASEHLGNDIIVAVIDTGVDYTHPGLSEAMMQGWDFYDNDNDPYDEGVLFEDVGTGHGTNVAGIIRQVAPRATILPIRVLGTDGSGTVANLATAILWAEQQGAHIINLSLGSQQYSSAVNAALETVTKKGVMVTASSGNSGNENVSYPASSMFFKNRQISVTSVDSNNVKSDFATYSKILEVSAPGEGVFGPAPGGLKVAWSGTSMAAPMVAGALALAKGENPILRNSLSKVLWGSTLDIDSVIGNEDYVNKLGKGRLDVNEYLIQINAND